MLIRRYSGETVSGFRSGERISEAAEESPEGAFRGSFLRLIGAHGGRVLKEEIGEVFPDIELIDDTCTGNRYLRREAESEASFFHWYVMRS